MPCHSLWQLTLLVQCSGCGIIIQAVWRASLNGSRCSQVFPLFLTNDTGAGIAQWYSIGLRAGWLGVWVLAGAGNFSLHHHIQTSSGAHPASYPMGTKGSFPRGKAAGAWSYTSTPQCAFMAWCLVKISTGTTLPLPLYIGQELTGVKVSCTFLWN
jgi:hypothetical protein